MTELNDNLPLKNYSPLEVEKKWQRQWEILKAFSPNSDDAGEPFCIVIPVSYTHLTLLTIYSV